MDDDKTWNLQNRSLLSPEGDYLAVDVISTVRWVNIVTVIVVAPDVIEGALKTDIRYDKYQGGRSPTDKIASILSGKRSRLK